MNPELQTSAESPPSRRWRPLESIQRRILGVLIEKAKTTPENYPLSLNALKAGCNQKNNRAPLMQLEESQIEEALEQLMRLGAVAQVQGGGRVDRYRHLAYEWLGVEKVELAVMAELLLRGAQTVGELRGRAARMEPIKDLAELNPTIDALQTKGLVIYLTPPGRGSVVSHALYLDRELEKVQREVGTVQAVSPLRDVLVAEQPRRPEPSPLADGAAAESFAEQIGALRDELATLRHELQSARSEFTATADELRRGLEDLNRQLGN